jgi:integrase
MADLVSVERDEQLPAFAPAEVDSARRYRDASRAEGTRAKYGADGGAFGRWCQERGHPALPAHPGAVAVYLSALADRHLAPSTVGRILAAIGHHRLAGLVAPHKAEGGAVILDVLAGIRRSHRMPPARKAAADSYVLHAVLRAIDGDTLADVRDRALLGFGMASALRRSELVALTVADLERVPDGLRVRVGRSKTDQEGRGMVIAVPDGRRLNPVAHLDAWLARAGIDEGPVFRSLVNGRVGQALTDQSVSLIVKRRVQAAGYAAADFAAHSLRAGFLTSAAAAGASIWKMREVSRHKSVQVLSDYVRNSDLLKDHAGKDFL